MTTLKQQKRIKIKMVMLEENPTLIFTSVGDDCENTYATFENDEIKFCLVDYSSTDYLNMINACSSVNGFWDDDIIKVENGIVTIYFDYINEDYIEYYDDGGYIDYSMNADDCIQAFIKAHEYISTSFNI